MRLRARRPPAAAAKSTHLPGVQLPGNDVEVTNDPKHADPSKLIAVLVIPLVGSTAMAAIGIAASVSGGSRPTGSTTRRSSPSASPSWCTSCRGGADLSAGWGERPRRRLRPRRLQRVLVNQALQTFRYDAENLDPDTEGSAFRRRVDAALKRFDQINEERKRIEADPRGPWPGRWTSTPTTSPACSRWSSSSPARPTTAT